MNYLHLNTILTTLLYCLYVLYCSAEILQYLVFSEYSLSYSALQQHSLSQDLLCNIPVGWGIICEMEMECGTETTELTRQEHLLVVLSCPWTQDEESAQGKCKAFNGAAGKGKPKPLQDLSKKVGSADILKHSSWKQDRVSSKYLSQDVQCYLFCTPSRSYITNVSILFLKAVETAFSV